MPKLQASLEGQRFGKWTVIGPPQPTPCGTRGKKQTMSLCRCDCGTQKPVQISTLKSGVSTSCGCSIGQKDKSKRPGAGTHRTTHILPFRFYSNLLEHATKRMYRVHPDLTCEFLQELYDQQKGRCALSGLPIIFSINRRYGTCTASLDRKDSLIHYTRENVQWVHKDINKIKQDFSQERFIELCRAVADTMSW